MEYSLSTNGNSLRQAVVGFVNSEKTDQEKLSLFMALIHCEQQILNNGLEEDLVELLIQIFVDPDSAPKLREIILKSLVPQNRIPDALCEEMLFWFCSHVNSSQDECALIIRWFKTMVHFKFVDSKLLDCWYDMMIKYLVYPKLVPAIGDFLISTVKAKYVIKWNVQLVEKHNLSHQSGVLDSLLRTFAKYAPHLVDKKYHSRKSIPNRSKSLSKDFEKAVEKMAIEGELVNEDSCQESPWELIPGLPAVEYNQDLGKQKKKLGDVKSMTELGQTLKDLQLPTNELTLIQNDVGIMLLVINGPSENFLHCLSMALSNSPPPNLIAAIAELQDTLTYGLPPVTEYLSDFLTVWDGQYEEQIVYSLLPKLHFDSYEDLHEMITRPLARTYFTCNVEAKVKIMDSILLLITHLVSVEMNRKEESRCRMFPPMAWLQQPESAVEFLIDYATNLMLKGITWEGPKSTQLILNSILFHQRLTKLILMYDFPHFCVIRQSLSYPALLSMNHVVVNELCRLILMYKKELIPAFERKGLLEKYENQVEAVMALADSTYKYLWEKEGQGRPDDYHRSIENFSPSTSIGIQHSGLYPLLYFIAYNMKRNVDRLTRNQVLELMKAFISEVWEFVMYEELQQHPSSMSQL